VKKYLLGAIVEQINRGLSLKEMVPHPLKYVELQALAERCERLIDESIAYLSHLQEELRNRDEGDLDDVFRGYRSCTRDIELIECFGISALYYETKEIGYLNKLISKIHHEINLPLNPPAVACISTKYYFFHPFTNVIFVPIGEHDSLLHLPDLYHKLGHEVLRSIGTQPRLKRLLVRYSEGVHAIKVHYENLLNAKKRETGPRSMPLVIRHIYSQWKNDWTEEFFADLFALFTLGPAYAWSHLHVTCKKTDNIYDFSDILPRTHPSDDARMRMLISAMRLLGWNKQADDILTEWNGMPFRRLSKPETEYQYAYPKELMEDIPRILLEGVRECNFHIVDKTELARMDNNSITKILNQAWDRFWESPSDFRSWEEAQIRRMKEKMVEN
jgi:hypothetical protein